ncbi:hypothetical protein HDU83_009893 [Entophlyctis luteolus]|nr:hypothetical protein HDU83_009893 [Entophlyctis luteolus]
MHRCATALLLAALTFVHAHPFLSTPNSECPLPTRLGVRCPVVCAQSPSLCPSALTDSTTAKCISDSTKDLCVDGSCAQKGSCATDLASACSCSTTGFVLTTAEESASTTYYPCSASDFYVVNVTYSEDPYLIAETPDLPIWIQCLSSAGVNSSIFEGGVVINECNIVPSTRVKNPLAPEFLIVYVIMAIELVIIASYYCVKSVSKRTGGYQKLEEIDGLGSRTTASLAKNGTSFGTFDMELKKPDSLILRDFEYGQLRFAGFTRSILGSAAYVSTIVTTIIWMALLTVLVLDYYAVFYRFNFRQESELLFNDHELLSTVFIVSWHFVFVWIIGIKVTEDKQQTWFGRETDLGSATFVLIEKKLLEPVSIANIGPVAQLVKRIESKFRKVLHSEYSRSCVPVKTTDNGVRYIEFECVRYVYNDLSAEFEPYSFAIGPTAADLHQRATGLSASEARRRLALVGENSIAFPVDSFAAAIVKEFSGFFYVYQMMTLWIWMYYGYYYMGIVILLVIVVSGIAKVRVHVLAQRRVLSIASFTSHIRVRRDGDWVIVNSHELVPGDVIEVTSNNQMPIPVDAILIDGGIVCDEASLTGEALPIVKFAIKNDATIIYDRSTDAVKNNSLFAGCYVLETQPSEKSKPVIAVVTATGAMTSKGRLVKDILFPSKVSFVFHEHLKVVFCLLLGWGIVMLVLSMLFLGTNGTDAWFYGMFSISQVLSPLLPAVLVIGQSVASIRLAKKGILCVDLDRITLSGKVKVFCFDKTGTLTKEGLDFLAVQPAAIDKMGLVETDYESFPKPLRCAMLCCHSVTIVGTRPVGNFVDVEMFRVTNAKLEKDDSCKIHPTTNGDKEILVINRFEFVHSNAYMTVVVQDSADGRIYVYIKGSFEKIREICDPKSVPKDASQVSNMHASEGCYVLGFARRELPRGTTIQEAAALTRRSIEQKNSIEFLGLCLFRNELKSDTQDALHELRTGGCRNVMITGDNVHTAVYVARKCGLIESRGYAENVLVVTGDVDSSGDVVWTRADNNSVIDDSALNEFRSMGKHESGKAIEIAITGKAFNALLSGGRMRDLLFDTRVFARMTPADKVACVRLHMERAITGMCGDGGNDAGALKAAHSGIALSEAESSVVAHFSSRSRSLFACAELLRESRCALDVSFASYKYLIMYGEVLALMNLIQYYFTVNMSQAMWILIDGSTIPLSWAMTQARPAKHLAATRPTARLLGPETLISVMGIMLVNLLFGIGAVVMLFGERWHNGNWFQCNEFDSRYYDLRRWWELADNFEGEVTGIVIVFQIVNAAAIFSIGNIYRSGFWRNWAFVTIYVGILGLLSFLTLADPNTVSCLFHINCGTSDALGRLNMQTGTAYQTAFIGIPESYHSFSGHNVLPMHFRLRLWLLCVGNLGALVLFQWGIVLKFGRRFARGRYRKTWADVPL